eukprot:9469917-Pyramimonas_sp.AAC.1
MGGESNSPVRGDRVAGVTNGRAGVGRGRRPGYGPGGSGARPGGPECRPGGPELEITTCTFGRHRISEVLKLGGQLIEPTTRSRLELKSRGGWT